jgi:hypothetical protein
MDCDFDDGSGEISLKFKRIPLWGRLKFEMFGIEIRYSLLLARSLQRGRPNHAEPHLSD